jgi:hypothetical protein
MTAINPAAAARNPDIKPFIKAGTSWVWIRISVIAEAGGIAPRNARVNTA